MAQINLIQNISPKKAAISPKAGKDDISNIREDSFEENFHQSLLGVKEKMAPKADEKEKKAMPANAKAQKTSDNSNGHVSGNIILNNLLGMNQPVSGQTAIEATDSQAIANNIQPLDNTQLEKNLDLTLESNETNSLKMQAYILPTEQDIKLSEDITIPLSNIKNTATGTSLIGSDDSYNAISFDSSLTVKEETVGKSADLDGLSINNKVDLTLQNNIADIKNDLNTGNAKVEEVSLKNDLNRADNIFDKVVVNQVLKGVEGAFGKGVNEIKIALFPPHLGTIHIKVSMEGDKVNTIMFTDNNTTKSIMESNIKDLKDAIIRQGLAVDQFTVTVGDGWGQRFYDDRRDMESIFYAGDNSNNENETISNISGIKNISGYYKVLRGDQRIDLFA